MIEIEPPAFGHAEGIVVERNVQIPMRDGTNLAADIFRPEGAGPWPVLVTRVPYNKDLPFGDDPTRRIFTDLNLDSLRVVKAGYVLVVQDTRGRFASEGEFTPFSNERDDGADTIEWAARQAWSTGKVGMWGVSYQGLTQWQAAAADPPSLTAIAPAQSFLHWQPHQGGAFLLSIAAGWTATQGLPNEIERKIARGEAAQQDLDEIREYDESAEKMAALYAHLPADRIPLFANHATYYNDWLTHPAGDPYWDRFGTESDYAHITAPALILAGWYDYFLNADLASYAAMRAHAATDLARSQTRLIVGPWSHGNFWAFFSDRDYASVAGQDAIDLTGTQLAWFDRWLKGSESDQDTGKPVRIFVMGTNEWRDEADWPLPDTEYTRYYLHNDPNEGSLSTDPPESEAALTFAYDPADPVPSMTPTTFAGPFAALPDQRPVESRPDVICFSTPPVSEPLEVTGPVELVLYASSSALDTDFTGKLVDVSPDGHADLLTDGILRARYRDSLTNPTLLEPNAIYEFRIQLGATSNVFLPGHRIRLEVSSSNFPRFNRNSNTGNNIPTETESDFITAHNTIHTGTVYPSHLTLPVINRARR